jgi:phage terminase small subunit
MPRPRVPNREKKLRGTFKRSQALPELVYSAPEAGAPPALNPGQAALLRLRPKGLPLAQARHYREMVLEAPWLTPIDREMLVTYVRAWASYRAASNALTAVMQDPDFHRDPKGAVAERGRLLMRTETRQASLMITAGSKLGFSAASRRQLGIEIAPAPVERKPDDAWEILKLVPGSKTPLIEDED